jgi:tRNA-modifying protein YgfZ
MDALLRIAHDRTVLAVTGDDAGRFLHDLVTNDIEGLGDDAAYAALLSPQGKYLFDFFVLRSDGGYWIDVGREQASALVMRLTMYRLRAKVAIAEAPVCVAVGMGQRPAFGRVVADPRDAGMGWRLYWSGSPVLSENGSVQDWEALRIRLGIPESGAELLADETYVLEAGFERLNGVSFRKGCYVGQEVTARMKHKTELKRRLLRVVLTVDVPPGTALTADGVAIGLVHSNTRGHGLAMLRTDRVKGVLRAGPAVVTLDQPGK